ncbi:MAG TPA: hypothetical protein VK760_00510 [Candidatus Acidoferrales bacterium]|jgi:hypothetical protein|nr:hypothetical protein [Candidatus Acidoferrales bacterium]
MNPDQVKAHAAGFLHALAINPNLAAQWQTDIPNGQRASMIASHLGLAQTPSEDDLHAMATYASGNLTDAVAKAVPGGAQPLIVVLNQS